MSKTLFNFRTLTYMLGVVLLIAFVWSCNTSTLPGTVSKEECCSDGEADFNGVIKQDVNNSTSDWDAYTPKMMSNDTTPNILFVLYDDTGLGAWSPYGGAINMPTLDALAKEGLTYTQWHTTALCSPTRSTILTGRNHHLNGMASITETSDGYPGANGRVPANCAAFAEILQDHGYATFWMGKNHNVPEQDVAPGGRRTEWPCQIGFDRFYGFLGGETNNWYPDLVEDNGFIETPETVSTGEPYHLSADLADRAIDYLRNLNASNPSKPFYMWFNPGANHAPHHSPRKYIDKYLNSGIFDKGYDAYRDWVTQRMKEKGVLPENATNTAVNFMPDTTANDLDRIRPWNSLKDNEKALFIEMAAVYAGFSEYTDAQVGRVIDYLKKTGQYDNTIILYAADNGASGEGSPNGSVNENKFFNGYPDEMAENLNYIGKLGGVDTYNHFPTGWAAAFSAPFKMFKRYANYAGGTQCPLVITWPKGIEIDLENPKNNIRHQYHHSVDIVPTLLEAIGIEMPAYYNGVKQRPLSGVSMFYTFDKDCQPNAQTKKKTQYYSMLGTRAIWHKGLKALAVHSPTSGKAGYENDVWELYDLTKDISESKNVANDPAYAGKLDNMIKLWEREKDKNLVWPLDDRLPDQVIGVKRPSPEPEHKRYTYYPMTTPVPEGVAVDVRQKSYKILANVHVRPNTSGVLFAHGSRFGGHTLFIKNKRLHYVYNFLGIDGKQQSFTSIKEIPVGAHTLGMEFIKQGNGDYNAPTGTIKLYIDNEVVRQGDLETQPAKFTLSGDGLCVGYDSGDKITPLYPSPSEFEKGRLQLVAVDVDVDDKGNPLKTYEEVYTEVHDLMKDFL